MSGETGLVYRCEAGTTYILCHQTMSRMDTWVKDSLKFIPERWMKDNEQVHTLKQLVNNCDVVCNIGHSPICEPAIWFRPEDVHRQEAGHDGGQRPRGEAGVQIQARLDWAASADKMRHPGVS